ncbi:hypothetical protein [Kutzneria sp. NPDC051319]|uniref:hypothetical protein n=1 Tax=Kutzneria sp. NPDC051319 TaxID=3155047 RepID=UPI003444A5C6
MTTPPAGGGVLVALSELENRTRPLAGTPDEGRAWAALADASALVRAEVPAALLGPPTPPLVVTVVCKAAGRVVRNPEGYSGETIGEYSYRYDGGSDVYLTEAELRLLRRFAGKGGLQSTRTPYSAGDHPGPDRVAVFYSDGSAGYPFPWWPDVDGEVPP